MKKIILLIFFITNLTNGQKFKAETKTITGIFEVNNKTKSEIYSSVNRWVSINYNSSKNVIQMNDLESGTIIIKGVNEITYENPAIALYPNNKYITEYSTTKFNHLVEINIKENRFRIKYKITGLTSSGGEIGKLFFDCINFLEKNNKSIINYNIYNNQLLKKGFISRKKIDNYNQLSELMFDDINFRLINDIKLTMLLIDKSILTSEKDDW